MQKSPIGICLAAMLLMSVVGCRTYDPAVKGDVCVFEFPFMGDNEVVNRAKFNWSDAWVTNGSYRYQHELAGPLAAIAASTYGSRMFMDIRSLKDVGVPPERLMRCYEDTGTLSYRNAKYGRDVTGFTIGSRMSELPNDSFHIVFVAIRGTVGREDWLSNINVANEWGSTTNLDAATLPKYHEGFHKAALFVLDGLENYVREKKIDLAKARILVTGHSRGAAAANLVGKMLDDAADGPATSPFAGVKRENVFVYTIATPNVAIGPSADPNGEKYRNINNIVSSEDIVPLVPFAEWGCSRYGRTLVLKCYDSIFAGGAYLHPAYVGMKNYFKDICGYEYWHMFGGTYFAEALPEFAVGVSPTIGRFYYVMPEMRAEGTAISTHSFFEMLFWRNIPSSSDPTRHLSLMGEASSLTRTYDRMTSGSLTERKEYWDHKLRFLRLKPDDGSFYPDGRDFSRQPGMWDIVWRVTCMHAPATYIAWMQSGVDNGPDAIYENWDEVCEENP